VQRVVLDQNVGDTVTVSVWREGKELDLRVKTAELPADSAPRKAAGGSAEGKLGLSLQTLTPELADRFGLDHAT
jgi:hypothetical protein